MSGLFKRTIFCNDKFGSFQLPIILTMSSESIVGDPEKFVAQGQADFDNNINAK